MEIKYVLVDNDIDSRKEIKEINSEKEIGVDLECENNLHHYGSFISTIQISSKTKNWIFDIMNIQDFEPLKELLENPKITKIFHNVDFDFRILNHQFGCKPKNLFDTEIAAIFLGKTEIGLGSLLEKYFQIEKIKKFQKADWSKRPMDEEMLQYAVKDSEKLIELKKILSKEIKTLSKDKFKWITEEFKELENKTFDLRERGFFELRGLNLLNPTEIAILKRIHELREKLAQKVNRPNHYIISTKLLIELAKSQSTIFADWARIKRTHPIFKKNIKKFIEEVKKGKKEKIELPKREVKRFSESEKKRSEIVHEIRDSLSEKLEIQKQFIMSKEQVLDIILNNTTKSLHNWQKEIIVKNYDVKDFEFFN